MAGIPRSCFVAAATLGLFVLVPTTDCAEWKDVWTAFSNNDCATVLADAPEIISEFADYAPAFHVLGECQHRNGNNPEAIDNLSKAVDLDPDNFSYALALIRVLVAEKQDEEIFKFMGNIDPAIIPHGQRTPLALLRAKAALRTGNPEGAIEVLNQRIAEDQSSAALHQTLGGIYHSQDNLELSRGEFQNAWELDRTDTASARTAIKFGLELARKASAEDSKAHHLQQTLEVAEELTAASPDARHYKLAGEARLEMKDYEGATKWLTKAHAMNPEDSFASYFLGQSLSAQGRSAEAADAFAAALKHCTEEKLGSSIHLHLGRILACRLELSEAAEHYRLAGKADRAAQINEIAASSRAALDQRAKLQNNLADIVEMEKQLHKLGDAQGLKTVRSQAEAMRHQIKEIEANLAEVRAALCG